MRSHLHERRREEERKLRKSVSLRAAIQGHRCFTAIRSGSQSVQGQKQNFQTPSEPFLFATSKLSVLGLHRRKTSRFHLPLFHPLSSSLVTSPSFGAMRRKYDDLSEKNIFTMRHYQYPWKHPLDNRCDPLPSLFFPAPALLHVLHYFHNHHKSPSQNGPFRSV